MKNITFLIIIILSVFYSCKKPDGKVSGVITYFFNKNYGDKADVGAKIYILSCDDIDTSKVKNIITFNNTKRSSDVFHSQQSLVYEELVKVLGEELAKSQMETDKSIEEMDRNNLALYGIKTEEDFNKVDKLANDEIQNFRMEKNVKEFVADGNGNFSTMLPEGNYYILVESNHRENSMTTTELLHQIYFTKIKVSEEKEVTVNENFTL